MITNRSGLKGQWSGCVLPVDIGGLIWPIIHVKRLGGHVVGCAAFLFAAFLGTPRHALGNLGKTKVCKLARRWRDKGRSQLIGKSAAGRMPSGLTVFRKPAAGWGPGLTFALREESSSTLLGFRSRWRTAGERLWRKVIPRATWWASLTTRGQGGGPPNLTCSKFKIVPIVTDWQTVMSVLTLFCTKESPPLMLSSYLDLR